MRPTLNLVRISGIFKAEQRALFHHRRPSPASLSWQGAPAADCKRKSVGTLPVYSVGTKSIKTGRVPAGYGLIEREGWRRRFVSSEMELITAST
jgi:hypothetical protein